MIADPITPADHISYFPATFTQNSGWRPEFKGYSMWVSLFGANLCVVIMFVVSVWSSIAICVMFTACLAYFYYSHPGNHNYFIYSKSKLKILISFRYLLDVNWGDSNQAHVYRRALTNLLKLSGTEIHVKNYRPQVLLISGNPMTRPQLLDFTHSITKGDSLLVCAHVVPVSSVRKWFLAKFFILKR